MRIVSCQPINVYLAGDVGPGHLLGVLQCLVLSSSILLLLTLRTLFLVHHSSLSTNQRSVLFCVNQSEISINYLRTDIQSLHRLLSSCNSTQTSTIMLLCWLLSSVGMISPDNQSEISKISCRPIRREYYLYPH